MLRQARAKIHLKEHSVTNIFGPTPGFFQKVNKQNPPQWIGLFNADLCKLEKWAKTCGLN
jgi:hypothetical protein